jgi:hypothetical protein
MKDLTIGMRVRATPAPIEGLTARWSGLTGEVVGFPGEGNVRVRFNNGTSLTCGPGDLTPDACEYFTRYSSADDPPGECTAATTLELVDGDVSPRIRVCGDHAATIVARFPILGGRERFKTILRSV